MVMQEYDDNQRLIYDSSSKRVAQERARKARQKGYLARVVRRKPKPYRVIIAKAKRSGVFPIPDPYYQIPVHKERQFYYS